MRPMTPTSLYTPPTGCHPTRPWWRSGLGRGGTSEEGWTRSDDWEAYDNGYHYYTSSPVTAGMQTGTPEGSSYDEVLAAVDEAYPLPPPKLRAGQVWLLEARQALTTALLNTTMGSFLNPCDPFGNRGHVEGHAEFYGVEAFLHSNERTSCIRGETLKGGGFAGFSEWSDGYLLGDQFLPARVAESLLLRNDPLIKAYLIADPANLMFTPWTGAKVGEW